MVSDLVEIVRGKYAGEIATIIAEFEDGGYNLEIYGDDGISIITLTDDDVVSCQPSDCLDD